MGIRLLWQSALRTGGHSGLLWLMYYIPSGAVPVRPSDGIERNYSWISAALALSAGFPFCVKPKHYARPLGPAGWQVALLGHLSRLSETNTGTTLLLFNSSQFAGEPMFALIHLEPILKNQFCFFGGSAQFGMPADAA